MNSITMERDILFLSDITTSPIIEVQGFRGVLTTKELAAQGFSDFQKAILIAASDIAKSIDANTLLFVSSTHVTFNGSYRTTNNGPNHVEKQAIDFIIASKIPQVVTDPTFNYARSLLAWRFVWELHKCVPSADFCIEDDHIHVHLRSIKSNMTKITLQSIVGKQKEQSNGNAAFFCQDEVHGGKKALIRDLFPLMKTLFN